MEGQAIRKAAASAVSQSKARSAGDPALRGCRVHEPAVEEGTQRRRAGTREREGWRPAHTETPAPAKRSLFWRSNYPSHRCVSVCVCV